MLEEIERLRLRLNQAYIEGAKLTDGKMIAMSQHLDKLLVAYQKKGNIEGYISINVRMK